MISEDIRELTDLERATISHGSNYVELDTQQHNGFSIGIYPGFLSSRQVESVQWTWHADIEIVYLEKGNLEILTDENAMILTPGNGAFINQNILHRIQLSGNEEAVYYSLVFHPDMIFGYANTPLYLKYVTPILEDSDFKCFPINSNSEKGEKILSLVEKIKNAIDEKSEGYELSCQANLYELWAVIFSMPHKADNRSKKSKKLINDEKRIKDAILYMEEHYADTVTLEEIASSIHISKSECCRCFQRVLHLSPFEYLLHYRILQATKLLQQKDSSAHSIADLAISVGFSNISYFNKVFKKYVHMTPTEYKKYLTTIV